MIKVENMSYSFPQKNLYNNVSFTIEQGQHCAFIGSSGSGKSTLVDIILNPDNIMFKGELAMEISTKIGCVSQFSHVVERDDMTVFDYLANDFVSLEKAIEIICEEMATAEDLESVMERYQEAFDRFEAMGGNAYESQINSQLNLADLSKYRDLNVAKLSGGEFKLIQIIKEMMANPELVIMDEPDVFLDFENLNALRKLLNHHKGTLLIITHNRYLLDHCFNKILHLENEDIREFDGKFIEYNFSLLQEKIEQQALAVADDEEIERNEALIERLRDVASYNADKARGKSLKARVKIQERLLNNRTESPYVEIKRPEIDLSVNSTLEKLEGAEIKESGEDSEGNGKDVLVVENYSVAFDDVLLEKVNFTIGANEKVALIGGNGTGKTTLMREIVKGQKPSIILGEDVTVSYLSQVQSEVLNESNTVLQEFMDMGFATYSEAETFLMDYGYTHETVNQKISQLSGGEKNILQIAKMSVIRGNLLLLDEPTSHLDTYSQMALEEAITNYDGAVLMISHDYYSIVNCMDYVLLIEDKTIRKVKMKKFKRMIYANYFDRDYLASEEKKKAVETKIALALKEKDFESARKLSEELEDIISLLI